MGNKQPNHSLKPDRRIASTEIQHRTASGKPVGMPTSIPVEPKGRKERKGRKKNHYATLMRMNCKDGEGVIKEQYCAETKKFSKNFYRKFGDRNIDGYATYDDGDRWNLGAIWLSMYPPSIRNGIMTFLSYFEPLKPEFPHIKNTLEEMQLLIHDGERAYYRSLQRRRKKFRGYRPPPPRSSSINYRK